MKFNLLLLFSTIIIFGCLTDDEEPVVQQQSGLHDCQSNMFTTGDISSKTEESIRVRSKLPSLGTDKIIQHGHLLKKGSAPRANDYDQISELGAKGISADFVSTFDNLDHSSTYYTAAYLELENSGECVHPEAMSFQTVFKALPEVTTFTSFTRLPSGEVNVGGQVNTLGKDVLRYGFVYVRGNSLPDLSNGVANAGDNLSGSVNNQSFNALIKDLPDNFVFNTSAFAENDAGVSYGDPIKIFTNDFDFAAYDLDFSVYTEKVFEDSFDENINNWFDGTGSSGSIYDLSGGEYTLKGSEDSDAQVQLTTFTLEGIPYYEIEVDLDITTSSDVGYSGLRWEGTEDETGYLFGIRDDEVLIGYFDNLSIFQTIEYSNTIETKSGDNNMVIRKTPGQSGVDEFHIFLNEERVHTFVDDRFEGNIIRVRGGSKTTADFDDLVVQRLL